MGERVLLVEGKDDLHVACSLLKIRGVPEVFKVKCPRSDGNGDDNGGIERLLETFPRWLLESDLERLAVVMDANDRGPTARWDAFRQRLTRRGYEGVPTNFNAAGTSFDLPLRGTPRSVRLGIWIMPDNRSRGMIEDFVAQLIPEDDDMLPLVDRFLESIPESRRRFHKPARAKARIHSWLAVGERPGRPMGQAIGCDQHLNVHHPAVQTFLDWIRAALVD